MNNFLWRRCVRIERRLRDRLNPLEEFSDEKCLPWYTYLKLILTNYLVSLQAQNMNLSIFITKCIFFLSNKGIFSKHLKSGTLQKEKQITVLQ